MDGLPFVRELNTFGDVVVGAPAATRNPFGASSVEQTNASRGVARASTSSKVWNHDCGRRRGQNSNGSSSSSVEDIAFSFI